MTMSAEGISKVKVIKSSCQNSKIHLVLHLLDYNAGVTALLFIRPNTPKNSLDSFRPNITLIVNPQL
jgi:hypothetical protein